MTKMYKLLKHFTGGKRDVSANISANMYDQEMILRNECVDISSNYDCDDNGCDNKCDNCNGCCGRDGKNGRDGRDGRDGMNGTNGRDGRDCEYNKIPGPTGPQGPQGVQGSQGPQGIQGLQGSQGSQGSEGPTGPVGQNAAISSIFVWSAILQPNINVANFQYVIFENTPIGPTGSGWTSTTQPGYSAPTNFIVPSNGFYLLTYKLDVRSGGNQTPNNTDCSTVLTRNGIQINGSATLVEAPEENHIYTISNTVLTNLSLGDNVSLLFWSSDLGTHIGDPSFLKGKLPGGVVPNEATASIVFTKISG